MDYSSRESAAIVCNPLLGDTSPLGVACLAILKSVVISILSGAVCPRHIGPRINAVGAHIAVGTLHIECPAVAHTMIIDKYYYRVVEIAIFPLGFGEISGDVGRTEFERKHFEPRDVGVFRDISHHALAGHVDYARAHLVFYGEIAFYLLIGSNGPLIVLIQAQHSLHIAGAKVERFSGVGRQKCCALGDAEISYFHLPNIGLFGEIEGYDKFFGVDSRRR